jgi:hypothetical protein
MSRKFAVNFSALTNLSPSVVYVSPSDAYPGKFSVAVLHPISASGSFDSSEGICRDFDLHQGLLDTEQEALDWAINWLNSRSGCSASINEIEG